MRHRQSQGFGQVGLQGLSCCHHCSGVLGSQPRAISISNNLVAATERLRGEAIQKKGGGGGKKTKAGIGNATVGLGFAYLGSCRAPKVGAGKNNMNSGEGHELNGSMDTHEEEGCRRLCSIEISAYHTRSDLQLFPRMHRLVPVSKLGPEICVCRACGQCICCSISTGSAGVVVKTEPCFDSVRHANGGGAVTCPERVSTVI